MSEARTVVITGAAGGIGSEIVRRFLAQGDHVIAADLDDERLARAEWNVPSPQALRMVAVDVGDDASVERFGEQVAAVTEVVDVLVNCAGYFPLVPFEDMTTAVWRRVIDVNLTGDFLVIKSVLRLLKNSGRGRIVNIGSGTMFVGTVMQAHYASAKGGVLALTRTLARELGKYAITVNLVTPGFTVTPAAIEAMPEQVRQMQRNLRALPRDEYPADIAGSVLFLASDDAAFVTGQTLNVDGGRHFV